MCFFLLFRKRKEKKVGYPAHCLALLSVLFITTCMPRFDTKYNLLLFFSLFILCCRPCAYVQLCFLSLSSPLCVWLSYLICFGFGQPLQRNWFKRKRNADRWMKKWSAACKNSTWRSRRCHSDPLACLHVSIATFLYFSVVANFVLEADFWQGIHNRFWTFSYVPAFYVSMFKPRKREGENFFFSHSTKRESGRNCTK